MNQAVAIYNKRLNALGTTEPSIQKDGTDRITIQLPGEKNPDRVTDLVGSTGHPVLPAAAGRADARACRAPSSRGAGISPKDSLWDLLEPAEGQDGGLDRVLRVRQQQAPAQPPGREDAGAAAPAAAGHEAAGGLDAAGGAEEQDRRLLPADREPLVPGRPHHRRATPTGTCSTSRRSGPAPDRQAAHRQRPVDSARRLRPPDRRAGRVDDSSTTAAASCSRTSRRSSRPQGKADYDAAKATDPTAAPAELRAAVRGHPRRRARDVPVHRLPAHARRHRQELADHGRDRSARRGTSPRCWRPARCRSSSRACRRRRCRRRSARRRCGRALSPASRAS